LGGVSTRNKRESVKKVLAKVFLEALSGEGKKGERGGGTGAEGRKKYVERTGRGGEKDQGGGKGTTKSMPERKGFIRGLIARKKQGLKGRTRESSPSEQGLQEGRDGGTSASKGGRLD